MTLYDDRYYRVDAGRLHKRFMNGLDIPVGWHKSKADAWAAWEASQGIAAEPPKVDAGTQYRAADVLQMADNPDVRFMTFKAAAREVLGDDTPSTKAEIVEALKAL